VQFDEPVLSEVVFGKGKGGRCFMCGALSARGAAEKELAFARDLLNAVLRGLPRDRTALHVCRGNWTPDEGAALTGDYVPLLDYFEQVEVGTYLLEGATPRAGDVGVLAALPEDRRIGVGVVNPKDPRVETVDEVLARARRAASLFGADRLLLVPDCGFATFADNPVASAAAAEGKLAAIAQASARLRA
jgi:5-methyltetrahydropteroyltriglutamate--homocysteine methyltransferase